MKSEVLTAINIKNEVFLHLTPYSLRRSPNTYWETYCRALKMERIRSPKILVNICQRNVVTSQNTPLSKWKQPTKDRFYVHFECFYQQTEHFRRGGGYHRPSLVRCRPLYALLSGDKQILYVVFPSLHRRRKYKLLWLLIKQNHPYSLNCMSMVGTVPKVLQRNKRN